VGGGGYCAARTEVSKHTNVGRNEITVVPGGTVEGHSTYRPNCLREQERARNILRLVGFESTELSIARVKLRDQGFETIPGR